MSHFAQRTQVVINPSARSGRGAQALQKLRAASAALPHAGGLEWVESQSPAHFVELVQKAQDPAASLRALAVAGGDGTVTMAIDALAALRSPQRTPLAVLPTGSGNDFANDIGASRSLATAFATLLHGTPRWVDVGEIQPGGRRFCCVASVGLDELALRHIHGSRFARSKALNIYSALRGLMEYRPRRVRVRWQGGSFAGEVMFCAVTNTRSYGGGFQVSPQAQVDDGALDLCIVPRMPKLSLLGHFPRILRGTHAEVPGVILAQSPWVEIQGPDGTSEELLPLCIDGELPSGQTPLTLRCVHRGLLVLGPDALAAGRIEEAA